MMLWFVLALMTAAAMVAVLWPLARAGRMHRSGNDLAVYRDQLDEIRRDRAAQRIGEAEADAAQVEVSRRLIAAADAETASRAAPAKASPRRAVAVAALAVLSLGTGALYLALGSPWLPDQPLSARAPGQSIDTLVAQVETHLASNPNDARGWEVIAPIYLRLGRFDEAIKARRKALALGETSERLTALGEALALGADGNISAEAKALFERAVAFDGENVKARYFLGVAAERAGRPTEAAAMWRAMLARAPADAAWADYIREELARVEGASATAGNGPTDEQMAAASDLSGEQRISMVRGMVARLAERLAQDSSDVEGWLRLVRSYMVLGEREKALAAAGEARRALAAEPDKLNRIEVLVKGLGLEG
ncbi:MAG: cytochrome c-type biosis protein CcmH [Alphaproteobacteria bacterium]|jgi:cytochrome c-type biogenesis protein CcmH|nr:cytochrome c-type biosis protein CcmH [Alphaproteobacteria bacterium]